MDVSFLGEPLEENNFRIVDVIKLGKGFSATVHTTGNARDRYAIRTDLRRLQLFVPIEDDVENYAIEKFDLSESTNKITSILLVRNEDRGIDYHLFEFDWDNNKMRETVWPLQT